LPAFDGVAEPAQWRSRDGSIQFEKSYATVNLFGVSYDIVAHPSLLVADHIDVFLDEVDYTEEYKPAVLYEDRHPIWLELKKEWDMIRKGLQNGE
jgi:hypothetical protein